MIGPMRRVVTAALLVTVAWLVAAAVAGAKPAIHAHRGGAIVSGKPTYPENTMPAFRQAATNRFYREREGIPG